MKKITFALIFIIIFTLCACSSETLVEESKKEQIAEIVLLDDEIIKVSFMKLFEEDTVKGTSYLQFKVENKTDNTITVCATDCYVNDTQTQIGSGVPMTIDGGKNSENPFIVFSELDTIEKLEIRLMILDENFSEIETTDSISVPMEG